MATHPAPAWRNPNRSNDRVARAQSRAAEARADALAAAHPNLPVHALEVLAHDTPPLLTSASERVRWQRPSPNDRAARAAKESTAPLADPTLVALQADFLAWLAANPNATAQERANEKRRLTSLRRQARLAATTGGTP